MSRELVLFDLPSKPPCRSWSGNALKTRLSLNYKGIPYTTKWVPYTKLKDTLSATGLPPNPQGAFADYTVPAVRLPDGTMMMDSLKIAPKLEELKPTPSLHLDTGIHEEIQACIAMAFPPLIAYFGPTAASKIVAEEDEQWWRDDRARRFGMSLEELQRQRGGETALQAAKPGFEKMTEVIRKHKKDQGPFCLGSEPCYGDMLVAALLHMFKTLGDEHYEQIAGLGGKELKEVYEAAQPWLKKMD